MHKSRLFEVFNALSPTDLKPLKKFIHSPFINQRAHVEQLLVFLLQARKAGNSRVDRQKAFAFIWPELPFDDHKLRLSMSLLLKAIEQYLAWQQFSEDNIMVKLQLAKAYRKLGLERQFNSTLAFVENAQDKQDLRDAVYFQNRYCFYLEKYQFNSNRNRMDGLPLAEVQTNFDISYLASKLKQSCLMLAHQAIYKKEYDFGMLSEALDYIERKGYLKHPAISIYYYAYKALIQEKGEDYFSTFKALIFQHHRQFPPDEIRNLYLLATNYCIQQRNQGLAQFNDEGLDIFKEGLKRDVLLKDGILSSFTYRNIVTMAIIAKDFNWAARFVETYKELLDPKQRESSFSYNMALLKYEQKEFDEALLLIHQIKPSDVLNNLSTKTIALKIYYEIGAIDLLQSHLDAMRSFLNRKKVIAYHREHFANTIRFTKKILDLPPMAREKNRQLRAEIEATAAVAEREWLLKQLL